MARPTNTDRAKHEAEKDSHKKAVPKPHMSDREMEERMRANKRREAGR